MNSRKSKLLKSIPLQYPCDFRTECRSSFPVQMTKIIKIFAILKERKRRGIPMRDHRRSLEFLQSLKIGLDHRMFRIHTMIPSKRETHNQNAHRAAFVMANNCFDGF